MDDWTKAERSFVAVDGGVAVVWRKPGSWAGAVIRAEGGWMPCDPLDAVETGSPVSEAVATELAGEALPKVPPDFS